MNTAPFAHRLFSLPGFALVLAAAIFGCFPDVLMGRSSFFYRDYGVLGYPVVHFFHDSVQQGVFPLWNPFSNCGVPFFAQWGTMGAYPLSAIYLYFPLPFSLTLFCFLHLWIGGVGMYLLARQWTGHNIAAVIAGSGYTFSGVMLASFIWPNYFVALAWMPFIVLLAERAWHQGGRWIAITALVAALQLGSGVPEVILLTWLIVGVLWFCDLTELPVNGLRMVLRLGSVVVIAAGLMAVQLLPFFDLLMHSQRDPAMASTKWSLPLWASANLIVPLLNCFEIESGQYFQYGQEFMSSVYLGLPIVVLAIVGVVKYPGDRTWALLLISAVAVLLAFGDNTPVFPLIKKAVPLAGIARYPVKFLFIPAFTLPLLAALAVKALHIEPRAVTRPIVYSAVAFALLTAALVWAAHEHLLADMSAWPQNFQSNARASWKDAALNAAFRVAILGGVIFAILGTKKNSLAGAGATLLAVGLLAFDGRTNVPKQNPILPTEEFRGVAWDNSVGAPPKLGEGRIFITPKAEGILLTAGGTNDTRIWRARRMAEWSNLNLLDRVPKVNGSATLQIREEASLEKALYAATNTPVAVLDFLGAAYESAPAAAARWIPRSTALPLVTIGPKIIFADPEQAQQIVLSNGFDARRTVVLPLEARQEVSATDGAEAKVLSSQTELNRVQAEVDTAGPAAVVIAQSYYHHWKATVDGQEGKVYRANSAFQAVVVPAGKHKVELVYRDPLLRLGLFISAGTGLLWLLLLIFAGRFGRNKEAVLPQP